MKRIEENRIEENRKDNGNFVIFQNYKEYFEMLNAEQVKTLMLSLFNFANGEEIIKHNDLALDLVIKTMTDNMIVGSKRRIASIENGKKGGRPKKEQVKKKQQKEKKEPKNSYGEFNNVKLKVEEEEKLLNIYGNNFNNAIDILDNYIESSGKNYKNHYAVLGKSNWVYKKVFDNNQYKQDTLSNLTMEQIKNMEDF